LSNRRLSRRLAARRTSVARGRSTPTQVGRPLEQSQSRAPCSTSAMAPRRFLWQGPGACIRRRRRLPLRGTGRRSIAPACAFATSDRHSRYGHARGRASGVASRFRRNLAVVRVEEALEQPATCLASVQPGASVPGPGWTAGVGPGERYLRPIALLTLSKSVQRGLRGAAGWTARARGQGRSVRRVGSSRPIRAACDRRARSPDAHRRRA